MTPRPKETQFHQEKPAPIEQPSMNDVLNAINSLGAQMNVLVE